MPKKKTTKKATPRRTAKKPAKRAATKTTKKGRAKQPLRRAGHPTKTEPAVTPDVLLEMSRLYGRGVGVTEIARQLNLHLSTVQYHRDKTFLPILEENMRPNLAELHHVCRQVRAEAWAAWERSQEDEVRVTIKETDDGTERTITRVGQVGNPAFLATILATIDWECKVAGFYAAAKLKIDHGGELRVAGKSRDELNQQMLERLATMMKDDAQRKALTA